MNGKNNCENSKRWGFFCCFIRFMLVRISRRHLHIKTGRGKQCSAEKRELIQKLISAEESYREVGRLVECSNKMIRNAIKFQEKPETRGRKSSIPTLLANRLV